MKPDSNIEAEEDFWDLGDEEELPLVPSSRAEAPESEESESEEESSEEESSEEEEDTPTEESGDQKDEDEVTISEESQDEPEAQEEAGEEEVSSEIEEPLVGSGGLKDYFFGAVRQLSLVEKVSLLSVIILLAGAASWGISTFYDQAPEGDLVVFDEDFPVEGTHVAVSEIETYWRKPVRTGENADHGVQLKAELIPCARIVLSGSGTAALAISFRNSDLKLIGDPISLDVENGTFVKSGTSEITITSTAGFENFSEITAYTNSDIDPWSLLIVEGAPGTNPSYNEADKKLAEVRISAESRE